MTSTYPNTITMIAGLFSGVMALLIQPKGMGYSKGVIKDHQPFPVVDKLKTESKKHHARRAEGGLFFSIFHF